MLAPPIKVPKNNDSVMRDAPGIRITRIPHDRHQDHIPDILVFQRGASGKPLWIHLYGITITP
jgi:hypothetical protein